MVQFLGIADILAAGILIALAYQINIPSGLVIVFSIYLLLKALIFLIDIGSWFDIIAGVLLILSLFFVLPQLVFFIAAGLLALKGTMSLFA